MGKKRNAGKKQEDTRTQFMDARWPIEVGITCPDHERRTLAAWIDVMLLWTTGNRLDFTVIARGRALDGKDEKSFRLRRGTAEATNFIGQLDVYSLRARAGHEEEAARFINQFGFRVNAAALRSTNAGKAAKHG